MRYWSITLARKVVRRCTNLNIQASFGLGIASQKHKGPLSNQRPFAKL